MEGVRSLNYDGCVKVLLRRRPTGSFIMLLPVRSFFTGSEAILRLV